MRYRLTILALAALTAGCGYSHRDNEILGQPKAIESTTPLLCPDQHVLDLSLGVLRNGVGSMSLEDMRVNVPEDKAALLPVLRSAIESGKLVNVRVNEARFRWCNEMKELVSVAVVEDGATAPVRTP